MRLFILFMILTMFNANATTIVTTVNEHPITDTDITARVKLRTIQGQNSTDNRTKALDNIIDDYLKLDYAAGFKISPSDKDVNNQIKQLNFGDLDNATKSAMQFAVRAEIAWQMILGRTIIPTIKIEQSDIDSELIALEREHGLPFNLTFVRLINIPENIYTKLTNPENCDSAIKMAEKFGDDPQKITALEYELSPEIREIIAGLPLYTWSKRTNGSTYLICNKTKTKEYGKLDDIIKQNAIYKKASFIGDQQLKQLRRKAIIIK